MVPPRAELQTLLDLLQADGRKVIGPTVVDGAIVCEEIRRVDELPKGVGDEQAPGKYRLTRRQDERVFSHVVGPTSRKRYTYPPRVPTSAPPPPRPVSARRWAPAPKSRPAPGMTSH